METLYLRRIGDGPDGTLGVLGPSKSPNKWATVEEEDQGNRQNISRIPAGIYICVRRWYNKGGYNTWHVTNVPNRSLILFHVANTEEDVEGCIGVGKSHGVILREDEDDHRKRFKSGVIASRAAFNEFMAHTADYGEQFKLVISDPGEG